MTVIDPESFVDIQTLSKTPIAHTLKHRRQYANQVRTSQAPPLCHGVLEQVHKI